MHVAAAGHVCVGIGIVHRCGQFYKYLTNTSIIKMKWIIMAFSTGYLSDYCVIINYVVDTFTTN